MKHSQRSEIVTDIYTEKFAARPSAVDENGELVGKEGDADLMEVDVRHGL